MITWVLMGILLTPEEIHLTNGGVYASMSDCFEAREVIIRQLPSPKINYEFVCIKTDTVVGI